MSDESNATQDDPDPDATLDHPPPDMDATIDMLGETVLPPVTPAPAPSLNEGFANLGPSTVSDLDRESTLARARGARGLRYEVQDEIGRGGMGKILRVQDTDLNRQVAMKVLMRGGRRRDERKLRFVEEAQINGQLQHPCVLSVHDFGVDANGDLFFTMQLIPRHQTLRDVIEKLRAGEGAAHEEWSFERRVQVIQQVCHALHYAHGRGVIHRDIKPDNIVVGQHGEVWLVDWGIARLTDARRTTQKVQVGTTADGSGSAIPEQGSMIGTPRYMAPEQIMGFTDEIDHLTDIYSLTAVLYELLTLEHYLGDRAERIGDLIDAVPNLKPEDAENHYRPLNGRVPRHLSRFCRKGLAKDRADRWQSAEELEEALQTWIEGEAPVVCPGTFMQRSLKRGIKLIDRAPVLVPALVITLGILGSAWVVYASVMAALGLKAG